MPTNPTLGSEGLDLATGIASAAIAIGQAVKRDVASGPNNYAPCDTQGERPDGIAYTAASGAGVAFTVVMLERGSVFDRCLSGASYAAGASLMVNSSGKLVTATSTNKRVGVALEAAGGADEWRAVALEDGDRAA